MDEVEELIRRLRRRQRSGAHDTDLALDLREAADKLEALTVSPEKLALASEAIRRELIGGNSCFVAEVCRSAPCHCSNLVARAAAIALGLHVG